MFGVYSVFSDVFDVDYFIEALKYDVPVIKKLPKTLKGEPKVIKQFRSWSYVNYYEEDIARLWQNYKVNIVYLNLTWSRQHCSSCLLSDRKRMVL